MSSILSLKGIKKSFGTKHILQGIDLDIHEGEIIGIIGPSGCGKSTLFKVLLGFLKPDSGSIHLKSRNITKHIKELRRRVGYTTQEDSFYQKLTLLENMKYYARLYAIKQPALTAYLEDILKKVDLLHAKDRLADEVSGGMRRRLNFAISLIHNPDILILDEPTTGLDPHLVASFWKIVNGIRKEGKTIILTSHIFPEIEENCDRIAILKQGRVEKVFTIKAIKGKVFKKFEEVLAA